MLRFKVSKNDRCTLVRMIVVRNETLTSSALLCISLNSVRLAFGKKNYLKHYIHLGQEKPLIFIENSRFGHIPGPTIGRTNLDQPPLNLFQPPNFLRQRNVKEIT